MRTFELRRVLGCVVAALMVVGSVSIGVLQSTVQPAGAAAIQDIPGAACTANTLPANDDGTAGPVTLPFDVDFFGTTYNSTFVNNNGNVTFNGALSDYTPFGLTTNVETPIIAPFFADVDTRGEGSEPVTYGASSDGGTFCVNWKNVGYFGAHDDLLNSVQLLLIDRSHDLGNGPGDFDIVMNYDRIAWETGDASGGAGGIGGSSAHAGYSNGTGDPNTFYEFAGSGVPGAFLDSNAAGLVQGSLDSGGVQGRYVFHVRNGVPVPPGALGVSQVVSPTSITPDGAASWVVTVHNPGPGTATGVTAYFESSSDSYGELDQFATSTGGECFIVVNDGPSSRACDLGDLAPGATATASGSLLATGTSAPGSITANAFASAVSGAQGSADPVVISVVSPASLPPGEVSGTAQPGVVFSTPGELSSSNPIIVKLKLPKKVAATAIAMGLAGRQVQLASYRPSVLPRAATVPGQPVPMSISTSGDEADTFCDGPCTGDVIGLAPFSHYTDPKHPASVTITWYRSLVGAGKQSRIFKRGDSPLSPRTRLNACVKAAKVGWTNLPCVKSSKVSKKGDVQFVLLVLSGDPKFARK